ncbi:MAG TPA: monovalent cation/H(+) antiporter subunit G [Kofleriaceae bacterium]|nr:monovalent cation/H(+) antiporter subunit G [Kofleriaceae bacterium]
MTAIWEYAGAWLVVWGALFVALAAIGILRMPDLYSRLHAASKAATLGVALLGFAVVLHFSDGSIGFRAIAFGLVLFLTAPISAHLIARAAFVTRTELAEAVVDDTAGARDRAAGEARPEAPPPEA